MDQVTIIDGKVFQCSQCGECCRHLDRVPEMAPYDLGTGVCRYLAGNKCSIYNQRPPLCRGEYLYHRYFEGWAVDDYYNLLYRWCALLRGGKADWQKTT